MLMFNILQHWGGVADLGFKSWTERSRDFSSLNWGYNRSWLQSRLNEGGKTDLELDNDTLQRLKDIAQLPTENKTFVLTLLDMALRDFKAKLAYK